VAIFADLKKNLHPSTNFFSKKQQICEYIYHKIVKIHHEKNHQLQQRVESWNIYIYIIILMSHMHGSKSFD
jgi:hypothetical protein